MPHLTRGRSPSRVTLGMSAVLFSLAGCSGGGSGPSPALPSAAHAQPAERSSHVFTRLDVRRSSLLVPVKSFTVKPDLSAGFADADAKSTAGILISDAGTNDVYAYTTTGKLVATVTGFNEPQGMFATKAGNFYVANTQSSDVLLYSANFNQVATLNDPAGLPVDVGYDETTGTVGVTNIESASGGAGSVSFYAKGSTTPCKTVSNPKWTGAYFGSFDRDGRFFVDGLDQDGVVVFGVITGGCNATAIQNVGFPPDDRYQNRIWYFPGGFLAFWDDPPYISYLNPLDGQLYSMVYVKKNNSLKTVGTTELTGSEDQVTYAFNATRKTVWTADPDLQAANEYTYPAGGSPLSEISGLSAPIGIAVLPQRGKL
jgi:hypothetical protein